ncbi:MAG: zinc ribbon domain-containing protein [Verrucomicrobia bacterium]|nr:MAG: zinc ribbon domain-containing protein [Verrucomicrobiota bacterium]
MPIYEFHCEECRESSEILVRSKDWTGTTCPNCGSTELIKQLSVFASSTPTASGAGAECSGTPRSCGKCGTGRPHSH